MSAACVACAGPIPESARASWVKGDRWCWGCRNYVCSRCTLARGPVPPGPHDPTMHGASAGPWPPQEPPPRPPDPIPEEPDRTADWDPAWRSYPVLVFDPRMAILEAALEAIPGADADDWPAKMRAARLQLRIQAAVYLTKSPRSTPWHLLLARTFLKNELARRTKRA